MVPASKKLKKLQEEKTLKKIQLIISFPLRKPMWRENMKEKVKEDVPRKEGSKNEEGDVPGISDVES